MGSLFSDFDLNEDIFTSVENQTGIDPRKVIDKAEKGSLTDREAENVVRYLDGDKVLQTSSELSADQLAHESTHAAMMDENGEIRLFGENRFDWRLYSEFAAYTAQDMVGEVEVTGGNKIEYFVARQAYMDSCEEAIEAGLPETDSLYRDFIKSDEIADEQMEQKFLERLHAYRESREQTLAAYAAKKFRKEKDLGLQEIINPDRQTYEQIIRYVKQEEESLLGG